MECTVLECGYLESLSHVLLSDEFLIFIIEGGQLEKEVQSGKGEEACVWICIKVAIL